MEFKSCHSLFKWQGIQSQSTERVKIGTRSLFIQQHYTLHKSYDTPFYSSEKVEEIPPNGLSKLPSPPNRPPDPAFGVGATYSPTRPVSYLAGLHSGKLLTVVLLARFNKWL
jgi:hypothetical protein